MGQPASSLTRSLTFRFRELFIAVDVLPNALLLGDVREGTSVYGVRNVISTHPEQFRVAFCHNGMAFADIQNLLQQPLRYPALTSKERLRRQASRTTQFRRSASIHLAVGDNLCFSVNVNKYICCCPY